jgi:hypothetical protein
VVPEMWFENFLMLGEMFQTVPQKQMKTDQVQDSNVFIAVFLLDCYKHILLFKVYLYCIVYMHQYAMFLSF